MTEKQAEQAAAFIEAIANSARIRMIEIMLEGELRVGSLADKMEMSRSLASMHLKRLKDVGLLIQRKHRQSRYCSIAPEKIDVLKRMIAVAEAHPADAVKKHPRP